MNENGEGIQHAHHELRRIWKKSHHAKRIQRRMYKRYRGFIEHGIKPGAPGAPGDVGDDGARGPQGGAGATGAGGMGGHAGASIKGETGAPGINGEKGQRGERGEKGEHGNRKGEKGPKGEPGLTGMIGADGATGATGETGPIGKPGDRGTPGIPGGNKGEDCLVPFIRHGNLFSFDPTGSLASAIAPHTFVPAVGNVLGYPNVSPKIFVTCDNGYLLKCPWVVSAEKNCPAPVGVPDASPAGLYATDMTCVRNEHWQAGTPICVSA